MDPIRNPYTPNAGAQPPAVLGRDAQLKNFDLLLRRMSAGRTEQSMIITGLRGVGKTVLLGRFRTKAQELDWVVVEREVSKHDDEQFRRQMVSAIRTSLFEMSPKARWSNRMRRAAAVLKSFSVSVDPGGALTGGIDVEAAQGFADQQDLQADLTDLLVAVGEAATDVQRGLVLLFDEVQFLSTTQLEALISALHKTVQRGLPVTMVGAGLPQIAELAGDAKSYSERLFKFPRIGNLDDQDARAALAEPAQDEGAEYSDDALTLALEVTGGYPYFLQELGYAVWGVADGPVITREDVLLAVPTYEAKLDESFFRVRLDRATEMERIYLRAMAELGPAAQKAQDVAAVIGRKSTQMGPTRAQLINMGLLYTPEHGYAAFTVPHFDKFLLRAIPELMLPPDRPRKSRKKD
ncbi:ATP-binding protein [Nocardioides sp. 503]|uniref:ATP-binding protein n=1 Tax=Nocardioides sp. 503 TaxID=2508326 RepID=UPI0010702B52|nr:ATP-binding protein [Nocardioides sp. 503]